MTKRKTTEAGSLRTCIGSARFGIESHQAPPADFPVQPSQKDGLGRMCKPHWNAYTNGLRKAALARKAEIPTSETGGTITNDPKPAKASRLSPAPTPEKIAKVRAAKARIAATETLSGPAYTDAIGSDEIQAALEVVAGADTATPLAEDDEVSAVA